MNLDWHADRSDLPELATLDQLAVEEPIDLAAVRSYRLGRVRERERAEARQETVENHLKSRVEHLEDRTLRQRQQKVSSSPVGRRSAPCHAGARS